MIVVENDSRASLIRRSDVGELDDTYTTGVCGEAPDRDQNMVDNAG
jgi:hypothetical protein